MTPEPVESAGRRPRVLFVDSSYPIDAHWHLSFSDETLNYRIYDDVPRWWRWVECRLGLDLYLAFRARRVSRSFDVIVAGSERVGIPLAFAGVDRPIIAVVYAISSPLKKHILRILRVPRRWAGVGCLSAADSQVLVATFGLPEERLFRYVSAPLDRFSAQDTPDDGAVLCAGVVGRDYETLFRAVEDLPDVRVQVFASSRYRDVYRGALRRHGLAQVEFMTSVLYEDMPAHYERSKFVVVPLHRSSQFSAGFSAALEACAAGRAVIASDTEGMREIVRHGETGLLVPAGDTGALREAIEQLWMSPELARRMGRAARQFVETHYRQDRAHRVLTEAVERAYQDSKMK